MAKLFIISGFFIFLIGFLLIIFPNIFSWFGNLKGDVVFEFKNVKIYFPMLSMLIFSIVLTIIINFSK